MNTQTQNPPLISTPSQDERTWATLAHASALLNLFGGVGGLIAVALIWLIQREKSAWVAFQALQAGLFQGTVLLFTLLVVGIVWVVGFIVSFATIGIGTFVAVPVMILAFIGGFAMMTAGMVYGILRRLSDLPGQEILLPLDRGLAAAAINEH